MTKKLKPNLNELEELLGSKERVLFFLAWLKHDRNATQAYLELHPNVLRTSAEVCGHKMLRSIKIEAVTEAYGLDYNKYYEQLGAGLEANKWNDFTGEREADHRTRKPYHDKLGKLLGIEKETDSSSIDVEVKVGVIVLPELRKDGETRDTVASPQRKADRGIEEQRV